MATYTKEEDVATTQEDDPQARGTLKEVFGNTARWSADFTGFTANVTVNINGSQVSGAITVKGPKEIEHSIEGEGHEEFLSENMASIAMHRGPRSFEESDGKYKLVFLDDGSHPQGRAISMGGDGMSSFYRIKDGRIHQINRKSPHVSFTINVEESVKNAEGRYLTHKYTVYYFDPKNGSLKDVESYTDNYTRVENFDLPEFRRVISAEGGTVKATFMKLDNHKLL